MHRWMFLLMTLACSNKEPVDPDCVTDAQFFEQQASSLLETRCLGCHNSDGIASETRYVLQSATTPNQREQNYSQLQSLIAATSESPTLMLDKPAGRVSHGGGTILDPLQGEYAVLHELVARLQDPGNCEHPGEPPLTCEPGVIHAGPSPYRRLTSKQYQNTIFDLLEVVVPEEYLPTTQRSATFTTWNSSNPVSTATAEGLLMATEWVTQTIDITAFLDCQSEETESQCAERALSAFAVRAFRRPLTDGERALVLSYLGTGLTLTESTQMSIQLILNLPQFLYLDASPGPVLAQNATLAHLDDYAVASRLAYFLTNSPPDATLLDAASRGELQTRVQVLPHAQRLVQDPRVLETLATFHEDWLNLYQLDTTQRDPEKYPGFSPELLAAMHTETALFVNEVIWSGSASWNELLFSRATWVNSELAAVYGLEDPGPGWHRVTLDETRPGLLTRSAFLTAHGYTGSSAPVKRGYFVLSELLCQELSVPPDVDMVVPEDTNGATTIRERLQQHQTDTACNACHTRIDPMGFAFEHFDAIGAWRDHWENGIAVDATGQINESSVDGVNDLLQLIEQDDTAKACYSRRWVEYALGRSVTENDLCTLETVKDRFLQSDGNIKSLVVDVALTDAFLYRNLGENP